MRRMTHGIYLSAIVAAIVATYLFASSGHQPQGHPGESQRSGYNIVATEPVVGESTPQTSKKPVAEHITHHLPARNQNATQALDDAQARIDALEAEVAEYHQLQRRLRDLPQQLSPERAQAQRADGRDHEWATSTELDLETMFIRDERLRDIQIEQLDCYREHCELTLNHPGSADGFPTQYFTTLLKDEERFKIENFNVMSIGNSESTQLILNKGEPADE